MRHLDLDVTVTRGSLVESVHTVHGVVVDSRGDVVASAGSPELVTFWRSSAKPFQIMPFIESGCWESLGWDSRTLAIACGSHGGEPEHVSLAARMLESIGLEEGDLACGPHEPLSPRGIRTLRAAGNHASRLHNNCSGKHAAMLGYARAAGLPVAGYEQLVHPIQKSILEMVARWSAVPAASIVLGVDGCGVVVFGLPLFAMALAYARLGHAASNGQEIPARVLGAMREHPFLVGGTDRFDTILIQETRGAIVAKVGAEGVYSATIPAAGLGIAIKVQDGAARAQHAALLHLLQMIDALPNPLPPALAAFRDKPVHNTRGDLVGVVAPAAANTALPSGARQDWAIRETKR